MKDFFAKKHSLRWLPLILVAQMAFSAPLWAADKAQTPEEASDQLVEISDSLKALTDFAERIDLGRIMVLQRKVTETKSLLDKNPMHMTTLSSFQDLVLTFRYSEAFMKAISTKCTEPTIQSIKKNIDAIIKSRGFDQSMNSSFVANFLGQLYNLSSQMKGQSLPSNLEDWFSRELNKELAEVLAFAKVNGDVPETYKRADVVYSLMKEKYREFEQINSKSKAYDMLTELMGLMELYKEMATRGARNSQG
jgi:hypothetical protein